MPAHIRKMTPQCQGTACRRDADFAVFNEANGEMGRFCLAHAQTALRDYWRQHPDLAPAGPEQQRILRAHK